jgi:hypothetical protein
MKGEGGQMKKVLKDFYFYIPLLHDSFLFHRPGVRKEGEWGR